MHFLSDVYVKCEACDGSRFNVATLEVQYKGKSIADVLRLTVPEAVLHFSEHPKLVKQLQLWVDVRLEDLGLHQPSSTLSGRAPLASQFARALANIPTRKTYQILDVQPTPLHHS